MKYPSSDIRFPAEWEPQSGIQLTWPHADSDWGAILPEVLPCFVALARAILTYQSCLIVCQKTEVVRAQLGDLAAHPRLQLVEINSNDTWARDHSGIAIWQGARPILLDFAFNGWGMKFAAQHDNLITRRLFEAQVFAPVVEYRNHLNFILEGGSLETDGLGTLLTTTTCLLGLNRNEYYTQAEIERFLSDNLGIKRFLWLQHGFLQGDDTDSHIDTLARFCDPHTIAYVQCDDPHDPHYRELNLMQGELTQMRDAQGTPYRLVPLPMVPAIWENARRLPATYANFLIINQAVLMPTYGVAQDHMALTSLQAAFPEREVIGIDCRPLIRQNGSLHCVTMQYPAHFLTTI